MAGSTWTCALCGAGNDRATRVCGTCGSPAPTRTRTRALWALLVLALVAGAAIGVTLLLSSRHRYTPAAPGPFPAYTTPVLPPTSSADPAPVSTTPPRTPPTTAGTSSRPPAKPCPDEAARYLPGGTGTALLVAQTGKSLVTVCATPDGRIFYDGQTRGQPVSDDTHIFLPAQPSDDGFVAVNGEYRYAVGGGRLVVSAGSRVLIDDELTTIG